MDGPVKLYSSASEREKLERDRDLYAIIQTVEHLERAYVRSAIPDDQYTEQCTKLISQFRTAQTMCGFRTPKDVRMFMEQYKMNCKAADHRLVEIGVPGTVEFGGAKTASSAKDIAETVHHFITLMDTVKLNMVAVDQVFPELNELMECLNRISALPADFSGRVKVREWLATLNQMQAHEELRPDQMRQLLMDLEQAYNQFHRVLGEKS